MKLSFLGAAQTVTGSQTLLEHYDQTILIDCGLFQGPKPLRNLNWDLQIDPKKLNFILITHVHLDHCGLLPRFYAHGLRCPIYISKPSLKLLAITLYDSAHLQEEDAKYAQETRYSHHENPLPLYTKEDVDGVLKLVQGIEWQTWLPLGKSLSAQFLRAGHILGAASLQISYECSQSKLEGKGETDSGDRKILTFSGDIGHFNNPLLKGPEIPHNSSTVIMETTYGGRCLPRSQALEELALFTNLILKRSGVLLIPAFAIGRTQELLWAFKKLFDENKIPKVPLYVDGPMSNKVTAVYKQNIDETKNFTGMLPLAEALESHHWLPTETPESSHRLCIKEGSFIVISSSGMLQGGRILHHLKYRLQDPRNGVLFTGYQAQGTKGRLLQQGIPSLRLHHQEIEVKATIHSIQGFSAHADCVELLAWLREMRPLPSTLILNHGELEGMEAFNYSVSHSLGIKKILMPKIGETITL